MNPFRENAAPPMPPPEVDNSEAWLESMRARKRRAEKVRRVVKALTVVAAAIGVVWILSALVTAQREEEERCAHAGGVYVNARNGAHCLQGVKEIHP